MVESRLLLCPHHLASTELLLLGHPSLCLQPHLLEGVGGGVGVGVGGDGKSLRGDGATGEAAAALTSLASRSYCLLTHSLTYLLTYLLTHLLTCLLGLALLLHTHYSLTHLLNHLFTHSLTH